MKNAVLFILVAFFCFGSLFAQKSINPNLTEFAYKHTGEPMTEGGARFTKEITDLILAKKPKLKRKNERQFYDPYSIKAVGDTLYCHIYLEELEYIGEDKEGKDIFQKRICAFTLNKFPLDSFEEAVTSIQHDSRPEYLSDIKKAFAIYQSTLKKKKK